MKLVTFCIAAVLWALAMSYSMAQETSTGEIEVLKNAKESIVNEEKDALKREVETINLRLENNEITIVEAERLKQEAAEKRALNIENRLAIIDNKVALLERNANDSLAENNDKLTISIFGKGNILDINYDDDKVNYDRRTYSDFVFAVGLNNVITQGESLGDSDFKIGGSRFAEIGWAWKTRVFKESNWLRIKYGFSFQFNGLKPTDNRYFVDTGAQTQLMEYPLDLDKSKFRMDNLVFPVHFEFGPSRKMEQKDYFRYSTYNQIKVGLGGYAGFNLGARQKLKFTEDGEDVKQKLKADYNVNKFVYGVSGYIGWRETALYVKYDLNPIFKDNPVDMRNISLGLRFDMD
ncbi:hypothetical protein ATE92_0508 [Ulvibacter sp. MAR_2010_11]|uniref:hypothetical protein n=1 Tax=Ulvibacter sp. MAR_2010_11 TaxID=1250229 RepID=UPI000C2C1749|nr:hypothetical protein [Ulvibacter sp. MAR_2010_11]PKA82379.1 hypothetical protein ATE92_0508 [Ulvibacter sp. MAR_2010_11]